MQKHDLNKLYGDKFFRKRSGYHWRAPFVCQSIIESMVLAHGEKILSAIDIGCATGDLVQGFVDLGIEAAGIEGSIFAKPYLVCDTERVLFHDLRDPLPHALRFDVVTCFEVAEHLEPKFADQFIETLTSFSDHLILSVAPPTSKLRPSKLHFNEQPRSYWLKKFRQKEFKEDRDLERLLLGFWEPLKKKVGIAAFYQNLLCVKKSND